MRYSKKIGLEVKDSIAVAMTKIASMTIKKTQENIVHIWAARHIGNDYYKKVLEAGNSFEFTYSNSTILPDPYVDVDIYVKWKDAKTQMWFTLLEQHNGHETLY